MLVLTGVPVVKQCVGVRPARLVTYTNNNHTTLCEQPELHASVWESAGCKVQARCTNMMRTLSTAQTHSRTCVAYTKLNSECSLSPGAGSRWTAAPSRVLEEKPEILSPATERVGC